MGGIIEGIGGVFPITLDDKSGSGHGVQPLQDWERNRNC